MHAETIVEDYCLQPKNSVGQRLGVQRYGDPACIFLHECQQKVLVMKFLLPEQAQCYRDALHNAAHKAIV